MDIIGVNKMKVLVLTCSTGGGHNACARYIKEEFATFNISCDVIDYMNIVGKNASHIAEKLYLDSTKGKGNVFKEIYKIGEAYSKTNLTSPVYAFNKMSSDKLNKFIKENNYDITICTHLFPALALTAIKKKDDIKFVNVATDYECIPFWEETNPDLFVIPSKYLKARFTSKGIKEDILLPIGIPVSSKFLETKKVNDLPTDKDIVLIVSGSMGFGSLDKVIKELLDKIADCYFVVICGNNKDMVEKLKTINNPNLIVKGFVNNMNDYIAASTVVITKPGGLTTTEVAVMRKPLIHMMPIPGVENYNASFFQKYKMSIKADNISDIIEAVNKLIHDKDLQQEITNNQKGIINNKAAHDLVLKVIDLLERKS